MRRIFYILALLLLTTTVAVAQSGNYQIRPGDTLRIEVIEDPELNRNVLVLPDGRISFPFAGTVEAAGRTVGQVERALSSAMSSDFASPPTVYVAVASIPPAPQVEVLPTEEPTVSIYFLGEVVNPGLQEIRPGTTILQGLALSGGFTRFAATERVQLRRRDPQTGQEYVYEINYKALTQGGLLSGNVTLGEGDVILVPERRLFE